MEVYVVKITVPHSCVNHGKVPAEKRRPCRRLRLVTVTLLHTYSTHTTSHGEAQGRLDASFPFGLFSFFSYVYGPTLLAPWSMCHSAAQRLSQYEKEEKEAEREGGV
jgi:hypothetical protein